MKRKSLEQKLEQLDESLSKLTKYLRISESGKTPTVGPQGVFRGCEYGIDFVYWDVTTIEDFREKATWRDDVIRLEERRSGVVFSPKSSHIEDRRGNHFQ